MNKLTSQMQDILEAHAEMGPLPIETLTPENARNIPLLDRAAVGVYGHSLKKTVMPFPLPVGSIQNKTITSKDGELLIRLYTPKGDQPEGGWPCVTYFHGGGWVIATLDTYDSSCRAICDAADCVVVSVAYRQAPEHQYPAAVTDSISAYDWVCKNAAQIGVNANKIAVCGESAGGNLAIVTCLLARDKGLPMPLHQVLIYPVTDIAHGPNTQSAKENMDSKPLNTAMLTWFYNYYVPEGTNRSDPYLSPLHAGLADLPSATVILAEIDPLRSEGQNFADKLQAADVEVNVKLYSGVTHEFFGLVGLLDEADKAVAIVAKDLRQAFGNDQNMIERWASKLAA